MRSDGPTRFARLAVGLGSGTAIAAVDSLAFGGEVSPIVIVVLLAATTATFGAIWGHGGWAAALATWLCVPLVHVLKYALGLPDTLHPNTCASILMLAAFTLLVAMMGTGAGVLIRRRDRHGGPA